jgi:hypothetical protein
MACACCNHAQDAGKKSLFFENGGYVNLGRDIWGEESLTEFSAEGISILIFKNVKLHFLRLNKDTF